MTLVQSSGRAAAPGLKPLRLPHARVYQNRHDMLSDQDGYGGVPGC